MRCDVRSVHVCACVHACMCVCVCVEAAAWVRNISSQWKADCEDSATRLCALVLVLLLRLLLLLAGLAVVCVAVVLSASKLPASGTFGALAVVAAAVAIGNVGAVKRESALSGAAGQSRAATPARAAALRG